MNISLLILAAVVLGGFGYLHLAITKLKAATMSAADDIRREITELTEAQQAVVALVNTNADALASVKAQLADALAALNLAQADLASFDGIAAQLDGIEQGLRSVLPATEPETPVDPQPETPPSDGTPEPEAPTGGDDAPVGGDEGPSESVDEPVAGEGGTPAEGGEQPAAPTTPAEGEERPAGTV